MAMEKLNKLISIANSLDRLGLFGLTSDVDNALPDVIAEMEQSGVENAQKLAFENPVRYLELGYHHQDELRDVTEIVVRNIKNLAQDASLTDEALAKYFIFAYLNSGLSLRNSKSCIEMTKFVIHFLKRRSLNNIISEYMLPVSLIES